MFIFQILLTLLMLSFKSTQWKTHFNNDSSHHDNQITTNCHTTQKNKTNICIPSPFFWKILSVTPRPFCLYKFKLLIGIWQRCCDPGPSILHIIKPKGLSLFPGKVLLNKFYSLICRCMQWWIKSFWVVERYEFNRDGIRFE